MPIHITFVRDPMHKEGEDFARVVPRKIIEPKTLYEYMAKDTALCSTDLEAAMGQLKKALLFFLSEGSPVRTPLGVLSVGVHAKPSDRGYRGIPTDSIVLHLRVDKQFYRELRSSSKIVVKTDEGTRNPVITAISNANKQRDVTATHPGDPLHIRGARLSFHDTDPETGVFFIAENGIETRASVYIRCGNRIVDCQVPELDAGTYKVEVRTRPSQAAVRKGGWKQKIGVERDEK